tara:strand:+ start:128 stop:418 length:291 start_codon:yes stop_codon:yes gene_type:complete
MANSKLDNSWVRYIMLLIAIGGIYWGFSSAYTTTGNTAVRAERKADANFKDIQINEQACVETKMEMREDVSEIKTGMAVIETKQNIVLEEIKKISK